MSNLMIHDLARSRELDRKTMSTVRGGNNSWLSGLGPVANVNIDVNQHISQLQKVDGNAINNVGVIGAGWGPRKRNVSPTQLAYANAIL